MFGYDELRAEQKRAARVRRPGPARHRHLDVHRDVRPGARLGSSVQLDYGAGGWEHATRADAADRQGRGHHRCQRPRPGPRDGVQPDRRRPARRRRSRTSRSCTATPRSSHKGLDTYGSRSLVVGGEALVRAADKVDREGASRSRRTCSRPASTTRVRGRPVHRQGHRPGSGHRRRRAGDVRGAQPARTASSRRIDADATYDPVNFSFPHGTHLCAMEVDTETGQVTMRKYVCVRRHRQHHQPADRRRAGARRPGPGHRAGAVGGGGLRRLRARWSPARSSTTCCRRRPTRSRFDIDHTTSPRRPRTRWAPRVSARRAPSPRRRPWSTRSSTPSGSSASTTSRCRARPSGSGRPSTRRPAAGGATEGAAMPHFDDAEPGQSSTEGAGA